MASVLAQITDYNTLDQDEYLDFMTMRLGQTASTCQLCAFKEAVRKLGSQQGMKPSCATTTCCLANSFLAPDSPATVAVHLCALSHAEGQKIAIKK